MIPRYSDGSKYEVQFQDFVPEQIQPPKILKKAVFESLQSVLERMNEWLNSSNNLKVLQIETVTLPNIHHSREEGSEDPELRIGEMEGYVTRVHQFFRLWYVVEY
ncbi:MAG: hypothetical protein MRZ79_25845 [Bacteroidia bacterium]|nr:hypothetical protein [Bacteroidia bacterium]